MIRFFLRRLLGTIPTLIGISLVTFIVLNLSMSSPNVADAETGHAFTVSTGGAAESRARYMGYHLPLFINLSIEDARVRADNEIARLKDDRTAAQAQRILASAGGAWLPYIVPTLSKISPKQRERALDALDEIAAKIGVKQALDVAPDRAAFWKRYWEVYGSDFKPVRAARLVRRLTRRPDRLAMTELRHLDTYCLPQLMEALEQEVTKEAKARVISLAQEITGADDPLDPTSPREAREAVISRWLEWWNQRYDRYTVFEGFQNLVGAFTETRYFRWIARIITLDFGVSLRDGRPVISKLVKRLPVTLLLSTLALIFAYAIAVPLGIISAVRRGGMFDRSTTIILFVLYSFPAFWMAMLLLRYFTGAGYLDIFPAQGLYSPGSEQWSLWQRIWDTAHHLVLPVFCLSFVPMAMLARYQRVGMLQVIDLDFMRTARAKGLSRTQVILRHGLRNGVIPVITMLGLQIPYLVSGSVVVEKIFGIPGMGLETFEAIRAHDQPWLLAVVTVTAALTMLGVVAADAVYAVVDPRIAPGRRQGGGR
ncbi:MAG: ABC transporter permease [Deltaproteobacteria bacterium]|nr:ABC transporter permease [Deltaproteobacteria bacterium]